MNTITRFVACGLVVLMLWATATPDARADQWGELIWDFAGPDVLGGPSTVEFPDKGVVLTVTPILGDEEFDSTDLILVTQEGAYVHVHTQRGSHWEPISTKEFWRLIDILNEQGFELTAEVVEEGLLIGLLLVY